MRLPRNTLNTVVPRGTTAQARPELAGTVLEDRIRTFSSGPTEPPVSGTLQERIIRSSVDGALSFYYRITALSGGNIANISIFEWNDRFSAVDVDFRTDGLGAIGPQAVRAGPEPIGFYFHDPAGKEGGPNLIQPTALSRFMFIRVPIEPSIPVVTRYNTSGRIQLHNATWGALLSGSFVPEP